jgi:hypothetical protein
MNKVVRLFAVVGVLVATGCASVQTQQAKYETGKFPEVGTRTTVSVGQVMITKYDYLAQGGAILREPVSGSFWMGRAGLAAGTKLIAAVSSDEQVFCQPPARLGAPCLKDTDADGSFDHAYTMNAYGFLVNGVDIPPASYRLWDQSIQDGFKYELIYQGIDNGVVRIAYREYSASSFQPGFNLHDRICWDTGAFSRRLSCYTCGKQ